MDFQRCKVINETLDKKPLEIAQNAVNFFNKRTYVDMQDMGIKIELLLLFGQEKRLENITMLRMYKIKRIKCFFRLKVSKNSSENL